MSVQKKELGFSRVVSVWVASLLMFISISVNAGTEITNLADGATLTSQVTEADISIPAGTKSVSLRIGTTQGAGDIVQSNFSPDATTIPIVSSGDGNPVYVKVSTKDVSGTWSYTEYVYQTQTNTTLNGTNITNLADGSTLTEQVTEAAISVAANAQRLHLRVGTTEGGRQLINARVNVDATSIPIVSSMDGNPVYVMLETQGESGVWTSESYVYQTQTNTVLNATNITNLADGSTLTEQVTEAAISVAANAQRLHLRVGTTEGGRQLINTQFNVAATSIPIVSTMDGNPVYVTLETQHTSGVWYRVPYVYQTQTNTTLNGTNITNLADGSTLTEQVTEAAISVAANAQRLHLRVGTTEGGRQLINTQFNVAATSIPIVSTMDGNPVYVTLETQHTSGVWYRVPYVYQTQTNTTLNGTNITNLADGSTLTEQVTEAAISVAANAQRLHLRVGTTEGGRQLINTQFNVAATSIPIVSTMDGNPVYVTLETQHTSGVWYRVPYVYQTQTNTTLNGTNITNLADGSTLTEQATEAAISVAANAQRLHLRVGTTEGGRQLVNAQFNVDATSITIVSTMDGNPVYVTLETQHTSGVWYRVPYVYQTQTNTTLNGTNITNLADGSTLTEQVTEAAISVAANAQGLYLRVGTTEGGRELINTRVNVDATSIPIVSSMDGNPVYVMLETQGESGVWTSESYVYQTQTNTVLNATNITDLPDGSTLTNQVTEASLSVAANTQSLFLRVGTSDGGREIVNSWIDNDATSIPVVSSMDGNPVYVWVETRHTSGAWYSVKYVYQTQTNTVLNATNITDLPDGSTLTNQVTEASLSVAANTQALFLRTGTTDGGREIVNSWIDDDAASIPVISSMDGNPVYVWVETRHNSGVWYSVKYIYQTQTNTVLNATNITDLPNGSTLTNQVTEASLSVAANTQSLFLRTGTTDGGREIVNSWIDDDAASIPVISSMDGNPVYVWVETRHTSGAWYSVKYVYQTQTNTVLNATNITDLPDGSTLTNQVTEASLSVAANTQALFLRVGTSDGGRQITNTFLPVSSSSVDITSTMDGNPVYVWVETRHNSGAWYSVKYIYQTMIPFTDSDGDGITDEYETAHGLDPNDASDRDSDLDGDGLSNFEEFELGIAANVEDSDGDGIPDGGEVRWNLDPAVSLDDSPFSSGGVLGDCADDKKIIHILNRLTFGPTPELYKQLKGNTNCGGAADTATVEQNIAQWVAEQFDTDGIPGEQARRQANTQGHIHPAYDSYEEGIAASPNSYFFYKKPHWKHYREDMNEYDKKKFTCGYLYAPEGDEELCKNASDPGQCLRDTHRRQYWQTQGAVMQSLRPVHSSQHIRTRLGLFWDNHFSTDQEKVKNLSYVAEYQDEYESDTFFMGAFGNFYSDLLKESAQSPTMLFSLNQDENVYSPNSVANENYARELLELYTMGRNNGYDQTDISQLARLLTGWGVANLQANPQLGRYSRWSWGFHKLAREHEHWFPVCPTPDLGTGLNKFEFHPDKHESGVYQLTFGADGAAQTYTYDSQSIGGEQAILNALQDIANRPETANLVCNKLAKFIVSDKPQSNTISSCEADFISYHNDPLQIQYVVQGLINSAEFNSYTTHRAKYKDDFEFGYGLARLFEFSASSHNRTEGSVADSGGFSYRGYVIGTIMQNSGGGLLHGVPGPDGRPETADRIDGSARYLLRSRFTQKVFNKYTGRRYRPLSAMALGDSFADGAWIELDNLGERIAKALFTDPITQEVVYPDDADKQVVQYLLTMMYGGYYDQNDLKLAYHIIHNQQETTNFDAAVDQLENKPQLLIDVHNRNQLDDLDTVVDRLARIMAANYKYSLQ